MKNQKHKNLVDKEDQEQQKGQETKVNQSKIQAAEMKADHILKYADDHQLQLSLMTLLGSDVSHYRENQMMQTMSTVFTANIMARTAKMMQGFSIYSDQTYPKIRFFSNGNIEMEWIDNDGKTNNILLVKDSSVTLRILLEALAKILA